MAFIDKAQVSVAAGSGGNGMVSFRHEKFVERGGPDGGDGGKGGDVIFVAGKNLNTLNHFRYNQKLNAENGEPGGKRRKHGKNGEDLEVEVPVGTVLIHDGDEIADFTEDGQQKTIARGGEGGYGNAHFSSSRRQAPKVAERGEQGDQLEITLELKMLADVGLVGLPNAGKSTLLSVVSNARPDIADYPFTTLSPNLGVADIDDTSLLIADIPGLIAGASEGKGLGDEFLRHVERTKVLIHVVDSYTEDLQQAIGTINQELKDYELDLSSKPQIIALSKCEGMDDELLNDRIKHAKKASPDTPVIAISSQANIGLKELLREAKKMVRKQRQAEPEKDKPGMEVVTLEDKGNSWRVTHEKNHFLISGSKIEKFARRTDFGNEHGIRRLRDIMNKMGITRELERRGAEDGDTIKFRGTAETIDF